MSRMLTCLWFPDRVEEAVRLYTSLLPDSRIDHIGAMPGESPAGPPGSVTLISFTLMGQPYQAFETPGMDRAHMDSFNHAMSLVVECDTQDQIDRLWAALGDGGEIEQCGWLRDRFGVLWQIVPTALTAMMNAPDPVDDPGRGARVANAMLQMVKLDIAGLEAAFAG